MATIDERMRAWGWEIQDRPEHGEAVWFYRLPLGRRRVKLQSEVIAELDRRATAMRRAGQICPDDVMAVSNK